MSRTNVTSARLVVRVKNRAVTEAAVERQISAVGRRSVKSAVGPDDHPALRKAAVRAAREGVKTGQNAIGRNRKHRAETRAAASGRRAVERAVGRLDQRKFMLLFHPVRRARPTKPVRRRSSF